jgi:hypothetical protein
MAQPLPSNTVRAHERDIEALLAFQAPYLVEKLTRQQMVPTADEARALFDEVKKFLVLQCDAGACYIPVFSRRVDEVWHQFVLYSIEYRQFCLRFFGGYLHHAPALGAANSEQFGRQPMDFAEFESRYQQVFGELPDLWHDDLFLLPSTRLLRGHLAERVYLRHQDDKVELVWDRDPERILVRVDARGERALQFILDHGTFFVRELPGLLDPAEQLALCVPLVAHHFLWVAP